MLDARRQRHQPKCVGDRRAALADSVGHLLVGQLEVLDQLLVGRGLLQRRQVLTVQVLDECPLDQTEVVGVANDGRDRRRGRPGAPPASGARRRQARTRCRRPVCTSTGCSTPISRIEAASSASDSSSKCTRG